jgi:hypothetical protein
MDIFGGCLADNVGAKVAVAALEGSVRVPEVGPGGLGHEGITEPCQDNVTMQYFLISRKSGIQNPKRRIWKSLQL